MTSTPASTTLNVDAPCDPHAATRLQTIPLSAVLEDVARSGRERAVCHIADPAAVGSRTAYAAWLRRMVHAWGEMRLPAVSMAKMDWPLASIRPQCLDAAGLLIADLREISPRMRPTLVPPWTTSVELLQPGVVVAAVDLCVRLAVAAAPLLDRARALTEGPTHLHSATRYLARCADVTERAPDLHHEIDRWADTAGPVQTELAVTTAQHLADRLANALEARVRTGW